MPEQHKDIQQGMLEHHHLQMMPFTAGSYMKKGDMVLSLTAGSLETRWTMSSPSTTWPITCSG